MLLYKLLLFLNGFALLWLYFTVSKLFCQEVFYLFIISLPVPVCHLLHPDYEYISSYLLPSVPIMPVQRSDSEFSQHHKTAPGPPSAIAVPTPTMLPVPIAFNNSIPSFPPYSFICKKTPGIFHPRSLLPTIFFRYYNTLCNKLQVNLGSCLGIFCFLANPYLIPSAFPAVILFLQPDSQFPENALFPNKIRCSFKVIWRSLIHVII